MILIPYGGGMKTSRQNARDIISGFLGRPLTEANRFEASRTPIAVYRTGDDFWCCPPKSARPCLGWSWEQVGSYEGRSIYGATDVPERFR